MEQESSRLPLNTLRLSLSLLCPSTTPGLTRQEIPHTTTSKRTERHGRDRQTVPGVRLSLNATRKQKFLGQRRVQKHVAVDEVGCIRAICHRKHDENTHQTLAATLLPHPWLLTTTHSKSHQRLPCRLSAAVHSCRSPSVRPGVP